MNSEKKKEEDEGFVDVVKLNDAFIRSNVSYYKSLIVYQVYINKYWRLKTSSLQLVLQSSSSWHFLWILTVTKTSQSVQFDKTIHICTIELDLFGVILYFDIWLLICADPIPPITFLNFYVVVTVDTVDITAIQMAFSIPLMEETGNYLVTLMKTFKQKFSGTVITASGCLYKKI